jgi:dTDP-4-amino-4,6-dideoxygalactose transaminase
LSSSRAYKIPLIDLRAQYRALKGEIRRGIDEVLESQLFVLGPAVRRFEEEIGAYVGCRETVGVASGSDALLLALMALGVGPGDAVLVPPFTFFSTVSSITRLGATPLFIDIDAESYLMTPRSVKEFIEERCRFEGDRVMVKATGLRVRAILPVHLFGQCCAMPDFLLLAEPKQLFIVEDVAQACGARTVTAGEVKFAGTFGDLGCFSFFPTKNLGGYGDGGLIATNSDRLAERLRMLRIHGENAKYRHELIGLNSRLDSLQAAVLSVKLRHVETWCEQRIERARTYHQLFQESGLVGDRVCSIPPHTSDKSHVFTNYVIRAVRRDELKRYLAERGVQTEIYYPLPMHRQECFSALGYNRGDFPEAELAASQVLALPIYPELTEAQQEYVVGSIGDFYGH